MGKIDSKKTASVQKATLSRLPLYFSYLVEKQKEGLEYVSSTTIAKSLKFSPIQVRKDLAYVASLAGKPKLGFEVAPLIEDVVSYLGYNNTEEAVLVGVGRLGRTLMSYQGFENYGLSIVAGFDVESNLVGTDFNSKPVFHIDKFRSIVERLRTNIGIITVPPDRAQGVADLMVQSGIKAIWNFAPAHIETPVDVIVRTENLAASLAQLSSKLANQMHNESIAEIEAPQAFSLPSPTPMISDKIISSARIRKIVEDTPNMDDDFFIPRRNK